MPAISVLIQPLGSLTTVQRYIRDLDQCANTPNAVQTTTPNETNKFHMIKLPGEVSTGVTKYIWLTSSECAELASLDSFYVKKTQSAAPAAYRQVGSKAFSTEASVTWDTSDSTQRTIGSKAILKLRRQ
jgi:hypothetical protein